MTAPVAPWVALADTLLQREALICRAAEGRPPRDFAGLYVGDDDLDRALATLPGLENDHPERAAGVRRATAAPLARARAAFAAALRGSSPVAALVRSARLAVAEAEVLVLIVSVEESPARQRLVAYVQDSVQLPQLTLATLARVFAEPGHPGERALAPDAGLRSAA